MIVYTDAMYDGARTPAGMVGIAIYDPEDPEHKWRYASAGVTDEIIARFRPREQYVGQLEVLAAVAAYSSRPEQRRDRDVIHSIEKCGGVLGVGQGLQPRHGLSALGQRLPHDERRAALERVVRVCAEQAHHLGPSGSEPERVRTPELVRVQG